MAATETQVAVMQDQADAQADPIGLANGRTAIVSPAQSEYDVQALKFHLDVFDDGGALIYSDDVIVINPPCNVEVGIAGDGSPIIENDASVAFSEIVANVAGAA